MKNVKSTKVLKNNNLYKTHFKKLLNINYLQVLGSTIYIFIHKKSKF